MFKIGNSPMEVSYHLYQGKASGEGRGPGFQVQLVDSITLEPFALLPRLHRPALLVFSVSSVSSVSSAFSAFLGVSAEGPVPPVQLGQLSRSIFQS